MPGGSSSNQGESFQGTGFTQQQFETLNRLFGTPRAAQPGPPGPQGPPGSEGPQGPQGPQGDTLQTGEGRFNAREIGFFDPHLDKAYGPGDVVTVGNEIYYRDVTLFIERIRDYAAIKGASVVRTNLSTCLKGDASAWYLTTLSNIERIGLRADENGVEEWCSTLMRRWKENTNVALGKLTSEKYTLSDARNRREPAEYVHAVIRHAKNADIDSVRNQLTFAHQGIASQLRVFVDAPGVDTTITAFIQALEMKKDAFFENAREPLGPLRPNSSRQNSGGYRTPVPEPRTFQQPFGQQAFGAGYGQQAFPSRFYNDRYAYNPQQQPYGGQYPRYQPNSAFRQNTQYQQRPASTPPAGQLPSPRQQLQLGAPPNGYASTSSNQFQRGNQRFPRGDANPRNRSWQGNFRQKAIAYQTSAEDQPPQAASEQPDLEEGSHLAEPQEGGGETDSQYQYAGQDEFGNDMYYGEQESEPQEQFTGFVGVEALCRHCEGTFPSKNRLHKHLREGCHSKEPTDANHAAAQTTSVLLNETQTSEPANPVKVIQSTASTKDIGTGFGFRGYNYAMVKVRLTPESEDEDICLDSGCGASLIDRAWLKASLPNETVSKMASPLRVRGVGPLGQESHDYVAIPCYLPATHDSGEKVLICFQREFHIVDDLRAKMLIGNDIIAPEGIVIDVAEKTARIRSCNATVAIEARQRGQYIRRKVYAQHSTVIPPHSEQVLSISKTSLPENKDYFFEPSQQERLTLFTHLVDSHVAGVLVRNDSDNAINVPRRLRLGSIAEINYESCFQADVSSNAATTPPRKVAALAAAVDAFAQLQAGAPYRSSGVPHMPSRVPKASPISKPYADGSVMEAQMSNGVTIYGQPEERKVLSNLIDDFPKLWVDEGFVDIPQSEWMKLPLRSDWESKVSGKAKVYPLGIRDREVVDKTFDEMHRQERLQFTSQPTPFSYPVFVVWKTLPDGSRKGRAVVDIRGLNDLILPDAYPLPLQGDIIASMQGCTHISVLDASSFFYQWRLHPDYWHMVTVVTHRGQESFKVPVMGCSNSIAYVQRQIDKILRPVRSFARAYVDDVVIGSHSFEEHVDHLRQVFELFQRFNISISPKKAFLAYPDVSLLGQKVNSFGLTTAEDKLKAISQLRYPRTLGDLEHYLGLTGYLRQYVHFYAQLAKPLQELKTLLLKEAPTKGNPRKAYASKTKLPMPSDAQKASFYELQSALSKPSVLAHFNPQSKLWIDLDASKEFGFGAVLFHVKDDADDAKWPARTAMQPIMFLSRLLTDAEKNYWPTELEIAGFVWVLKKVRHLVESCRHPVIVQTDHSAILDIMKQSSITATSSTVRMNVRLVRASQFLRQYRLDVRHKPGKEHIIPDALSRLASTNVDTKCTAPEYSELDVLYTATMVGMSEDFRRRLVEGYRQDEWYSQLFTQIDENEVLGEDAVLLPFTRGRPTLFEPRSGDVASGVHSNAVEDESIADRDLLYHVDWVTGQRRLCIPSTVTKEIFELAHGSGHPGYQRTHEIISASWYVRGLAKQLREYVRHCPDCLVLQTRRHRPYGSLNPIETPPVPYHTLTLDFVLALPESQEGYNAILSVTDKFTKGITNIPGKTTWTAAEWADAFLERVEITDWGIPKAIISDRDRKFLSEFWQALFKMLGVSLLYSTAYHPQTDGSSERTNQSVEIALRFYIHSLDKPSLWPKVLPRLQAVFNNSASTATGKTPNEVAYGFTPNRALDLIRPSGEKPNFLIARASAKDAIAFANANSKRHYDRRHHPMFLKVGDWALLRLHKGYSIPSTMKITTKLAQQYVGPFRIVERVGRLAYRLEIPGHWRIHPVFTIAQLEPSPAPNEDPFDRPRPDQPDSVYVEGDTDTMKSFEIDRLLDKRVMRKGRGFATEYLVRWKGWGPQWDEWFNVKNLDDATDLVEDYEREMDTAAASSNAMRPEAFEPPQALQTPPAKRGRGRPRKS